MLACRKDSERLHELKGQARLTIKVWWTVNPEAACRADLTRIGADTELAIMGIRENL